MSEGTAVPGSSTLTAEPIRGGLAPPKSAVATSTGIIGGLGLVFGAILASRLSLGAVGASMLCLAAAALPMIAWAMLIERVHLNPTTGMDYANPREIAATIKTTRTKLVGLWSTWGIIAAAYSVLPFYDGSRYGIYFAVLIVFAPTLLLLSIPYVFLVDRYMAQPKDSLWNVGRFLAGGWRGADMEALKDYARSWTIKAFFLAFMMSVLPVMVAHVTTASAERIFAGPAALATFAIAAIFLLDGCFGTIGYILTLRPLDSHIRTANPSLAAWVAVLICYPPVVLMGDGAALDYRQGVQEWHVWFAQSDVMLAIWGGLLVCLAGIYSWSTVIFGIRFSNLTHRGILTNGPYRFFKHPAYLSKNVFWWMLYLPFLSAEGGWNSVRNCILLLMVNMIYYIRARTEERHLSQDPDYISYSHWMAEHGSMAKLRNASTRAFARVRA